MKDIFINSFFIVILLSVFFYYIKDLNKNKNQNQIIIVSLIVIILFFSIFYLKSNIFEKFTTNQEILEENDYVNNFLYKNGLVLNTNNPEIIKKQLISFIINNYSKNGYNKNTTDDNITLSSSLNYFIYSTIKSGKIIRNKNDFITYLQYLNNYDIVKLYNNIFSINDFSVYYNTCLKNYILSKFINKPPKIINIYKALILYLKKDYTNIIHHNNNNLDSINLDLKLNIINELDKDEEQEEETKKIKSKQEEYLSNLINYPNIELVCTKENEKNFIFNKICLEIANTQDTKLNSILNYKINQIGNYEDGFRSSMINKIFSNPFYLLYLVGIEKNIISELFNLVINDIYNKISIKTTPIIETFTNYARSLEEEVKDNTKDFLLYETIIGKDNIKLDKIIKGITCVSCATASNLDYNIKYKIFLINTLFNLIKKYYRDNNDFLTYQNILAQQIANVYLDNYQTNNNTIDDTIVNDLYNYLIQQLNQLVNIESSDLKINEIIYEILNNKNKKFNNIPLFNSKNKYILAHPFLLFTNLLTTCSLTTNCIKCLIENNIFDSIIIDLPKKIILKNLIDVANKQRTKLELMMKQSSTNVSCKINQILIENNNFKKLKWTNPNNTKEPAFRGPNYPLLVSGTGLQFYNNDNKVHRIKYFRKINNYLSTVIDTGDIEPKSQSNIIRIFELGQYIFTLNDTYTSSKINLFVINENQNKRYGNIKDVNIISNIFQDTCNALNIKKPNPPFLNNNAVEWTGNCKDCNRLNFNTIGSSNSSWNKEYTFTCMVPNTELDNNPNNLGCESDKSQIFGPVSYKNNGNPTILISKKNICDSNNILNVYRRDKGQTYWTKINPLNREMTGVYNGKDNVFVDNIGDGNIWNPAQISNNDKSLKPVVYSNSKNIISTPDLCGEIKKIPGILEVYKEYYPDKKSK
jgi:hypothetical protein